MNPASASTPLIGIDDLRIGMFIHLDMGWMSHPFPLGSFKIASSEQIQTIRSLGVTSLRWNPSQSDPAPDAASGHATSDDATGGSPHSTMQDAALTAPGSAPGANDGTAPGTTPELANDTANAHERPEQAARAARRRLLADQRASQQHCERRFAAAVHECRALSELALQRPKDAKAQAELLSQSLVQALQGEQDMAIRLLTEAAGDKASAHAMNVTVISLLMGRALGLSEAEMLDLAVGAMLHDIGKLELPDRVRYREDHFTGTEMRFYEEHVAHGVGLARRMGLSPGASMVIAQHHEHADGSGFPLRLNTDRMTPAARIVALVNRYDNLCNPHISAKALTPHESLSLLFAQGKAKVDTAILGVFIRMMGVYPAGSIVQLTDDRYGLVSGVNSTRPLKPRVLVFEPGQPADEALILDLQTLPGVGIRRSLKPQQLPGAALDFLSPRQRVAYFFEALALEPADEGALAAA